MWGRNVAKSHPHEKLFHVNSPMSNTSRASTEAFPSEELIASYFHRHPEFVHEVRRVQEEKTRKRIYHVNFVSIGKQTKD